MTTPSLKIGDTVWQYDGNHRIYAEPEPGRLYSGILIYRYFWRKRTIVAETSRSWIIDSYPKRKIPKTGPHNGYALSQQEVDDACWNNTNRCRLAGHVGRFEDTAVLKKIAALIGYVEKPEPVAT